MEPKNPIVIDGVDVSGCIYYQYNMCTATKDDYGDCSFYCKDYEMKDCYYKQFKCEERERQRTEQKLILIRDFITNTQIYNIAHSVCDKILQIIDEV